MILLVIIRTVFVLHCELAFPGYCLRQDERTPPQPSGGRHGWIEIIGLGQDKNGKKSVCFLEALHCDTHDRIGLTEEERWDCMDVHLILGDERW